MQDARLLHTPCLLHHIYKESRCSLAVLPLLQVISLTPQGPIGKFVCKMRTFSTLCLLHQVLLKEMFHGMFVHKHPPRGQHETMTAKDPLDYVDFVEVCAGGWGVKRSCPHELLTVEVRAGGWGVTRRCPPEL